MPASHYALLFCIAFVEPQCATAKRVGIHRLVGTVSSSVQAQRDNGCADILRDGVRNEWRKKLRTNTANAAADKLRKFDEDYSFEQYQEDHKKAQESGSSTSTEASGSASYGLFAAEAEYGQSDSQNAMSKDEFNEKKENFKVEKRQLEQSSSRSGSSDRDEEILSKRVSEEVVKAWGQCKQLAESNIESKIIADEQGYGLTISLTYRHGSGPLPRTPHALTNVLVRPPGAANCEITDYEGKPRDTPVTLEQGHRMHIHCDRNQDVADKTPIYVDVLTNVADALRAYFADALDLPFQKEMKMAVENLQSSINAVRSDFQHGQTKAKKDIQNLQSSIDAVSSKVDAVSSEVEDMKKNDVVPFQKKLDQVSLDVESIKKKLKNGICRNCYTCGDKWPKHVGASAVMGQFSSGQKGSVLRYGRDCGGDLKWGDDPRHSEICCSD